MTLLFLEALGAGLILLGIIWWTMFSGRKNGELPSAEIAPEPDLMVPPSGEPVAPSDDNIADKNAN